MTAISCGFRRTVSKKNVFIIIVDDTHSKWLEIIELKSTTANKTIEKLHKLFASYGLLEQMVTDNGPQFISEELVIFVKANGVKHIKSFPYHLATNGAVERLVQACKKSMKASDNDIWSVLEETH